MQGEHIATVDKTLERREHENRPNNVKGKINLDEFVVCDEKYEFVVTGSPVDDTTTLTRRTHETRKAFTLPADVIRENDLKPGQTLRIDIYEHIQERDAQLPLQSESDDASDLEQMVREIHREVVQND